MTNAKPSSEKWWRTFSLSLTGAAAAFAGTWLIVWLFGLALYADYLIDLAKVSLLLLALEVLPNGYSLFRQQRDEGFARAYPGFYAASAVLLVLIAAGLAAINFFERPNGFLVAYVGLATLQRYFDCQLQSRGQLAAFYSVSALTNIIRVASLGIGAVAFSLDRGSDPEAVSLLLWGSLTTAMLLWLVIAARHHADIFRLLFKGFNKASFATLWSERQAYRPYYLNAVIKRARDTMLPLLLDLFAVDKAFAGLILVYFKSFEVVASQLRILEATFTNLAKRARFAASRTRIAWLAAAIGQPACIIVAAVLLFRDGHGAETLVPALVLSFSVYPYVFEILFRNDALAAERPRSVTASLLAFVIALFVGLITLDAFGQLIPIAVALVLLVAYSAASLAYRVLPVDRPTIERR